MLSSTPPPEEETQADRDRLIKLPPLGKHRVHLGPLGYIARPHFGRKPDWAFANCVLVLVEFLGSGMWLRYPKSDIIA